MQIKGEKFEPKECSTNLKHFFELSESVRSLGIQSE